MSADPCKTSTLTKPVLSGASISDGAVTLNMGDSAELITIGASTISSSYCSETIVYTAQKTVATDQVLINDSGQIEIRTTGAYGTGLTIVATLNNYDSVESTSDPLFITV